GQVVLPFVIDGDADERDLRAVGRELGITDPVEAQQILLGDGTLRKRGECKQQRKEDDRFFHNAVSIAETRTPKVNKPQIVESTSNGFGRSCTCGSRSLAPT